MVNLVISAFTAYIFLSSSTSPKEPENGFNPVQEDQKHVANLVEIWSKAAIGDYLWEHVLGGKITQKRSDGSLYGFKRIHQTKFKFRSAINLNLESLRYFVQQNLDQPKRLVLVLNGRDEIKVKGAIEWLDEIRSLSAEHPLLKTGLLILGNETCHNEWLKSYLKSAGGPLSFAFVVYDWEEVDDEEVFQWPLGVSTYRNFPLVQSDALDVKSNRRFVCNFLGTLYKNSSRVEVSRVIQELNREFSPAPCFLKGRTEWEPQETEESLYNYLNALQSSDLTLSPVGMNHECYRIYEALSFGSMPVIEEDLTLVTHAKSNCDQKSAYRLLKKYGAPVIYVKNWTQELPTLMKEWMDLTLEQKVARRSSVLSWYSEFKHRLRDQFIQVVAKKFD